MIKAALRAVFAALYAYVGYVHIANPEPFLTIMPPLVPFPEAVVFWTGVAEILGAIALLQPFHLRLRQAGGVGLALYALCVWPANIHHLMLDMASNDGGLGLAYHAPRMVAQPILIWLALWFGEVPLSRRAPTT